MNTENKAVPLASIPNEHQRSDVGTYLNLPSWSQFFIKEEFFAFLKESNTREFPYWESIKTYWRFYFLSYSLAKNKSISLLTYFRMFFSALLFTNEYILKIIYESCFSFLRKSSIKSPKEKLIDIINDEYLQFIKNNPWYEFDFLSRLVAYYKYSSVKEKNDKISFNRIEKNLFLTLSFLFKQFVAKVIKVINSINYTQINKTTVIELDYFPEILENNQGVNYVGEYNKHLLLELQRYKGIKEYIKKITLDNNLYTISGNKGVILVSCIFDERSKISLIKLIPVIINEDNHLNKARVIYPVPVNYLIGFMKYCKNKKIDVEHILEY